MYHNTLVHLLPDDNLIGIRTYSRKLGRRGRFLVDRENLSEWLNGNRKQIFYDRDCGDWLSIRYSPALRSNERSTGTLGNPADCASLVGHAPSLRDGEGFYFTFNWLSTHGDTSIYGYEQSFFIPEQILLGSLDNNAPTRYLCKPESGKAHIEVCSPAIMKRIQADPLKKRAFIKAMRDCFCWHGDTVRLYDDGGTDFYFTANGAWSISGGLILHEGTATTPNGSYPKLCYSVHT